MCRQSGARTHGQDDTYELGMILLLSSVRAHTSAVGVGQGDGSFPFLSGNKLPEQLCLMLSPCIDIGENVFDVINQETEALGYFLHWGLYFLEALFEFIFQRSDLQAGGRHGLVDFVEVGVRIGFRLCLGFFRDR